MKITVASEHAGADYRIRLGEWLTNQGIAVNEISETADIVGYPAVAEAAALSVVRGDCDLAIVICGTGIGVSMAAGKVPGTRVALCADTYMGRMAKEHNNANVLAFGSRVIGFENMLDIITAFLDTEYESGRHEARLVSLAEVEHRYLK
ncbi:MAG: RpiB/LacA/LacB family sugar-phosphate isomerase [Oscillospiraceae bacterium]